MKIAKIVGGLLGIIMLLTVSGGFFIDRTQTATANRLISSTDTALINLIDNLHNWELWHEWNKMNDSSLNYRYIGSLHGKGAERNWTSNNYSSGKLRIEYADSLQIKYYLEIGDIKNIVGHIQLTRMNKATNVHWTQTMYSRWNPYVRYMYNALNKIAEEEMNRSLLSLQRLGEKNN